MKKLTQNKTQLIVNGDNDSPSNKPFGCFCLKASLLLLFLIHFNSVSFSGDIPLNFQLEPGYSNIFPGNCGIDGQSSSMCVIGQGSIDPDTTPFYQGRVSIDGNNYWHIIVGDPANGFAMESYVPVSGLLSATGGKPSDFFPRDTDLETVSGNGWDPLGLDPSRNFDYTGNGSADPTKVVLRQVMGGIWDADTQTWSCGGEAFCSEFLKEEMAFKPKITQTINDVPGMMISDFELDMSSISYNDDSTAGTIKNTLIITDPDMPTPYPNAGDFDMMTDRQAGYSTVTGGRYTYTPACTNPTTCWSDGNIRDGDWDFEEGSYSYVAGDADPLNYEWDVYWNPDQNPIGPGNEAKCDSGIITGTCP